MDDLIVESVALGAQAWVSGMANALPKESVRLLELRKARNDRRPTPPSSGRLTAPLSSQPLGEQPTRLHV